jgi:hypothetical protein
MEGGIDRPSGKSPIFGCLMIISRKGSISLALTAMLLVALIGCSNPTSNSSSSSSTGKPPSAPAIYYMSGVHKVTYTASPSVGGYSLFSMQCENYDFVNVLSQSYQETFNGTGKKLSAVAGLEWGFYHRGTLTLTISVDGVIKATNSKSGGLGVLVSVVTTTETL